MTQPAADGLVFTARRALWATILNMTLGALLSALTIANLVHQVRIDGAWGIAVLFVILALFFFWQGWSQFRDRSPVIEISRDGLRLPAASDAPVAWPRIWHVHSARGLPGLGGGRVDFVVDAETFARLKLGQRFMGDIVVKKRSVPNAFSVITPQLDESAGAIFAAVKRYWPPPDRGDDNQDEDEEQEDRRGNP
jgi:hypothetical protein